MSRLKSLPPRVPMLSSRVGFPDSGSDAKPDRRITPAPHWKRWYKTQKWKDLREQILLRDLYTCKMCGKMHYDTSNLDCDHKIPHRGNEQLFWDPKNLQTLCQWPCHKRDKQREEAAMPPGHWDFAADRQNRRWGFSIPDGVKPSGIPVMLVCGPPAAGKTAAVQQQKSAGDLVIDLDDCLEKTGGRRYDLDKTALQRAFALRDWLIKGLHERRTGRAWLIVQAPTAAERKAWKDALGDVTVQMILAPQETSLQRILEDPARAHAVTELTEALRVWWEEHRSGR